MLVSGATGKRYVGQTADLERRLAEHNSMQHNPRKHTSRNQGPWRLVLSEEHLTRAEAMRREKWLKSGAEREWLNANIDRAGPPQAD